MICKHKVAYRDKQDEPFRLPPLAIIPLDEPTATAVYHRLTSIIAGEAQATTPHRFYEEIDLWLGPWGNTGYPIAYGKTYTIAFTQSPRIMNNPATAEWVRKTTILLQEALRDYLVGRVRNGTLRSITEAELRKAAFESHPRAYENGGFAQVVLMFPSIIFSIGSILWAELWPTSANFASSWKMVATALQQVIAALFGNSPAGKAGPVRGDV